MLLSPYQIAVPLLSLVAVFYAWSLMMRKKKTVWEVILWTLFWGSLSFIALKPDTLSYLSFVTGIKNHENAVIVTSIGILFFLMFYIIVRVEELSQRQTRIVRAIALQKANLQESKESEDTKES